VAATVISNFQLLNYILAMDNNAFSTYSPVNSNLQVQLGFSLQTTALNHAQHPSSTPPLHPIDPPSSPSHDEFETAAILARISSHNFTSQFLSEDIVIPSTVNPCKQNFTKDAICILDSDANDSDFDCTKKRFFNNKQSSSTTNSKGRLEPCKEVKVRYLCWH